MIARRARCLVLALLATASGCERDDRPLTVFAAASASEVIQDAADRFERTTGTRVRCSFAASSTLARQIELGARADVFVSAHRRWCDHLEERGLADPASRRDLFANELVVVVPARRGDDAAPFVLDADRPVETAFPGRIAIADPGHVPAGIYAQQALEAIGAWDDVQRRMIATSDVRGALRLAELGEADAAIVYASDAARSGRVQVAARFPVRVHDPIRYAVVLTAEAREVARAFAASLLAPESAKRFESFGFLVPER